MPHHIALLLVRQFYAGDRCWQVQSLRRVKQVNFCVILIGGAREALCLGRFERPLHPPPCIHNAVRTVNHTSLCFELETVVNLVAFHSKDKAGAHSCSCDLSMQLQGNVKHSLCTCSTE